MGRTGTEKPLAAVQSDQRKAQKAAWLAGKKPAADSDDEEDTGKKRAAEEKKKLADARAAAGKKGAMSLGNQGIKKSGKK